MIDAINPKEPGDLIRPVVTFPLRETDFLYPYLRLSIYRFFYSRIPACVFLPDYVPEGLYAPFQELKCKIIFYPVGMDMTLSESFLTDQQHHLSQNTLFVYVHHFGMYVASNVSLLNILKAKYDFQILEDFAHTLPTAKSDLQSTYTTYSFNKMVGVSEGGLLRHDLELNPSYNLSFQSIFFRYQNLLRFLVLQKLSTRGRFFRQVASVLSKGVNSYRFLMRHMKDLNNTISSENRHLISHLDYEAISILRKRNCQLLLSKLKSKFLLTTRSSYLQNPLFAFPVKVEDPEKLHLFLFSKNIHGFQLQNRWWFSSQPSSSLYQKHYLLPVNHHLSENQINYIADCINEF